MAVEIIRILNLCFPVFIAWESVAAADGRGINYRAPLPIEPTSIGHNLLPDRLKSSVDRLVIGNQKVSIQLGGDGITNSTGAEVSTAGTLISTSPTVTSTPALVTCGYCPKKYIGSTQDYIETPVISADVNQYRNCTKRTECATVVVIPDGYYFLFYINLFMVPGDTLTLYDGDVSAGDQDRPPPLAVYRTDDTTTDRDRNIESNGNRVTFMFKFLYYGGHYPQSFYKARYSGLKADCSCPSPMPQSNSIILTSPNFPHFYCPITSKCEYMVDVSHQNATAYCANRPVSGLTLSFSSFDLATQDHVAAYMIDERGIEWWLVNYFGDMKPTPITVNSLQLRVVFTGENAGNHTGFRAMIQIECGHPTANEQSDSFHITLGTLAIIGLCSVAMLVILIVTLLAMRENRRWRRRRALRRSGASVASDLSEAPISIVGPLPSYNDALHCLKWEPNSAPGSRVLSRAVSREDGALGQPPPYTARIVPGIVLEEMPALEMSVSVRPSAPLASDENASTSASGHENHGFNSDDDLFRQNLRQNVPILSVENLMSASASAGPVQELRL